MAVCATRMTLYALAVPASKTVSHNKGSMVPVASYVEPGVYQHYKGDYYQVFCVARDTESEAEVVVYQSLYGDFRVWARPLEMFMAHAVIDGQKQPRFKKVADSSEVQTYIAP